MIKYLISILIILSSFKIFAQENQDLEERYIEAMALTFQGFEKEGGESIWPNFCLTDYPTIFHFQNKHLYAFGLNPSSLWENRLIHHSPVLFLSHYPSSLPPLHPAFLFEKQRTFVMSLDHGKDNSFLPLLTFVHERFHIYQFQAFYKEKVVEAKLNDYQNPDLLAWIELEHHALTSFLQANESETKIEHLKDYVAIGYLRRQFFHPYSIKWEDHQQKMEGLADYVSIKTFQKFPYIPHFNAEEFILKMRQKKNGAIVTTQDAMKERHYFVGAVLGLALDFCRAKDWKSRIEKEEISLHSMLENIFYMNESEKKERCLRLQQQVDWIGIRKHIEQKLESDRKQKEEIIQVFMAQEGVTIHMGTPSGHMSSGGTHERFYQVDQKKALMVDTSIATSQDQAWMLHFYNIPLIFEEQNGDRIFKLPLHTILFLNGKPMSLLELLESNQKQLPFLSLSLKHDYCKLTSKRSGEIFIKEEEISFKFH